MRNSPFRPVFLGFGLAMALLVAGCGVKPSQLEPPAGADPADIRDPNVKKAPPRDGEKPEDAFILDKLLM